MEDRGTLLKTAAIAAVFSLVACRLLIGAAARWHLVGKPALRRPKVSPGLSHLGGMGLAGAAVMALACRQGGWGLLGDPAWQGWVLGGLWLIALGLMDDLLWELPPWLKGIGQLTAVALLIRGGISVQVVYWPAWCNLLVTIIWVMGLTNALNLLDILDGLAATVAGIASVCFAVLASWSGQQPVALLAAAVCGALVGFLVVNWAPARLYMGDAGSQWLGFTLSAIALAIHYAPLGREVALATPLIILGLPVFDVAFVVWMRVRQGRSPFRKSRDHFALRLVSHGTVPAVAVARMGGLAGGFGLAGLYVARAQNLAGSVAVALVVLAALCWARRLATVRVDG